MKIIKDINKNIFRGYDIRGFSDKDLNEDVFYTLGRAYATFLSKRRIKESSVGRDNRLTSKEYSKAFIKGLNDGGISVYDLGLSLSQIVYYSSYDLEIKGSAMITASHNPKEMNGIKLGVGYSDTMLSNEIQQMYQIIQKEEFSSGSGTTKNYDIYDSYKKGLLKHFNLTKKWKVVVDAGNSVAGNFYPDLLRSAGCVVIEKNTNLDGNFPLGAPDPTESEFLHRVAVSVKENNADIGFAYDADGDRMSVVDELGNVLWMDTIISIFAKDVLDYMPGSPIVFNTLCSRQVIDTIEDNGGVPVICITGHSFVKAKIREVRAPFGGELSGHIFFMDNFYGHDDGAYANLRLLQYLERVGKTLSQVVSKLPKYISSPEIKLGLSDDIKFEFVNTKIKEDFLKLWPKGKYTEIDGVRVDLEDSMIIIRASQNGPYITIKFEAKSQEKYDNLKHILKEMLFKYNEIDRTKGVNVSVFD